MRQIQEEQTRDLRSLEDILTYKTELREKIDESEARISALWGDLFHKEEAPRTKSQKFAKMLTLGTSVFDGVMLGWKLYRKYQSGVSFVNKKHKR